MDYDDRISYRDEIVDIAEEMTNNAKIRFDGDGYITVIEDELMVHLKIDGGRDRDSFRIYEGLLMDEYGGHTDPLIKTDDFDHAKTEWRIYLRQNTENDENGGGEQSGLDSF